MNDRKDRLLKSSALTALHVAAPDVAAGQLLLQQVASEAGDLSAEVKALIAAAAAAVKGHDGLLREALVRARDLGTDPALVWGTASILPTSRGTPSAERFAGVALEVFGDPAPGESALTPDADDATAYFVDYYGEIPPRIALLRATAPDAYPAFYLLHRSALQAPGLEPKIRELILCAINAADLAPQLARMHAAGARRVGATLSEIVEAIIAVLPIAGLAVWVAVADTLAELG